ncbi:MAG: hypothetical protein Tsb0010_17860 [Parvularculaceae bacterium]
MIDGDGFEGGTARMMRSGLKIAALIAFAASGWILAGLLIWSPERAERWRGALTGDAETSALRALKQETAAAELRRARLRNGAPVYVLGDSLAAGVEAAAIAPGAVNLAVGRDRLATLSWRIARYDFLDDARVIVLAAGVNDLIAGAGVETVSARFETLLDQLPRAPVAAAAILPVDEAAIARHGGRAVTNAKIAEANARIEEICAARSNCRFVAQPAGLRDAEGALRDDVHEGDGLHLNGRGARLWAAVLSAAVKDAEAAQAAD